MMNRYSSLLSLSTFSIDKLNILNKKKILIIGVGGVGQHLSTYLITNGIKDLTIIDYDKVEISNLNRQILLSEEDIGKYKVDVVKKALKAKNKEANITSINMKVDENSIKEIIKDYDVVIDAVDNWKSKLLISKAVKEKNIPLLHVGVDGSRGQYCLFKNASLLDIIDEDIISSPHDGVMGPMVGLISSMAALHLLRYLINEIDEIDYLYHYDQTTNVVGKMKIK